MGEKQPTTTSTCTVHAQKRRYAAKFHLLYAPECARPSYSKRFCQRRTNTEIQNLAHTHPIVTHTHHSQHTQINYIRAFPAPQTISKHTFLCSFVRSTRISTRHLSERQSEKGSPWRCVLGESTETRPELLRALESSQISQQTYLPVWFCVLYSILRTPLP